MKPLVVYKKSTFELYNNSPDEEVRRFANSNDPQAVAMRESHVENARCLDAVVEVLSSMGIKYDLAYRAEIPKLLSPGNGHTMVISVGGDGTLLDVSHYVSKIPILGVNSDQKRSRGFFCSTDASYLSHILKEYDKAARTELSRLSLSIDGVPVPEPVLNDFLLAHPNPAAMTRYAITAGGTQVNYRSSGLLVCTAAGSSAFMFEEGGSLLALDSKDMEYTNRSVRNKQFRIVQKMDIESLTRECNVYIDGEHVSYPLTLGSTLSVNPGKPLTIIGNLAARRELLMKDRL